MSKEDVLKELERFGKDERLKGFDADMFLRECIGILKEGE